jgi:carboxylate-amine ligase
VAAPTSGSGAPEATAAGATLGVEEEFHVVDPASSRLVNTQELAAAALHGEAGADVHAEIAASQLETTTGVCRTLAELRAELQRTRAAGAAAAARVGLAVLPASTHPSARWQEQELVDSPRYEPLVRRWAVLARQQDICGTHVHVGVPDLETAVAVMDRARVHLPVLLAMTGSSPFHDGGDTGYDSFRSVWWSRWAVSGTPEHMGSAERYREVVAGLVAADAVPDATYLYWDLRPSARHPTLEFRVADVCTHLDDAVLHAALARSLVRVLAARAADGQPAPDVRPELMRAARWRAGRHGLSERLFDPVAGELVDAPSAVRALVGELAGDLDAHGELSEVEALLAQLLERGTSATRQRAVLARTGDPAAVVADLLRAGGVHPTR